MGTRDPAGMRALDPHRVQAKYRIPLGPFLMVSITADLLKNVNVSSMS